MKILFVLRKNANPKTATIQVRVTISGVRASAYSSGVEVLCVEWDAKLQKIETKDKKRLQQIAQNNTTLQDIADALLATYNELQVNPSVPLVTAQRVVDDTYAKAKEIKPFLSLIDPFLEYIHTKFQHSENTIKSYKYRRNNMTMFLDSRKMLNCYCEEITPATVDNFVVWLIKLGKKSASHVNKNVELLQKVVSWAHLNGFSTLNKIQSIDKQVVTKKEIEYMEMNEVLEIYNKEIPDVAWRKIVDVFTFACLTSLDHCDMKNLKQSNIYEGLDGKKRIKITRQKSTQQNALIQDLPFVPLAQEIWEKHEGKLPLICLDKYNQYLQQIYPFYGITTHLTSKIARKTAGTHWLDIDIPLEIVSKMLGHKKIQTTMDYYAKVKQKRAEKEQQKLY